MRLFTSTPLNTDLSPPTCLNILKTGLLVASAPWNYLDAGEAFGLLDDGEIMVCCTYVLEVWGVGSNYLGYSVLGRGADLWPEK